VTFLADFRYAMASAADLALDLAMPATCVGCYREGTTLCRECGKALDAHLQRGAIRDGGLPGDPPAPLVQLESCAPLAGITRRALARLTDAGEYRLSARLGAAIARRWATAGAGGDVIVPVPASRQRIESLGYDEAVLLARAAGRRLRLPVVEALMRTPAESPETVRTFDVRAADRIDGRTIILVDDIVTTGATLAACATALLRAGAKAVSAVTVAHDAATASRPLALAAMPLAGAAI
jgi:predicted amidophosphoribosyltransferase